MRHTIAKPRMFDVIGGSVPRRGHFLGAGSRPVATLCIVACLISTGPVSAQTVLENFFVTNGPVSAFALSGSVLYIGGSFSQVGPATGGGVLLDPSSGAPIGGFPKVIGDVRAVAPDGSGGWFIGGDFTAVGGVARSNLAHILNDNSLAAWDPGASHPVYTLAVGGTTVYVGGAFTTISGQSRNRIAALDASTGLASAWNPNADSEVHALVVSGGTVYTGGAFAAIGGQTRLRIAALDAKSGLALSWNPSANGTVAALAVSDGTIYAGGNFLDIGGQARPLVAALDALTGLATSWNPNPSGPGFPSVSALAVNGTTVYIGGIFTSIGGQSRTNIAAVDATTGLATTWNPDPTGGSSQWFVSTLAANGSTVYAGGRFLNIGGQARNNVAELDAFTGLATGWNPNANGSVSALAVGGSTIYVGGSFRSLGGQARNSIAALDVTTGAVTPWDPNSSGEVRALAVSGTTVFAGGFFTTIGGQSRNNIAALDVVSGIATGWNPDADRGVSALAVNGTTVLAGGIFTTVGGQARSSVAALDMASGLATPWNPDVGGFGFPSVSALVVSGAVVYVGGDFASVGGNARNNIAAVDATTGLASAWNPDANQIVTALAVSGTNVYAGGYFGTIGGEARNSIAALDAATGLATSWNPNADGGVNALAVSGNTVYAGGDFTSIGGEVRRSVAQLDATTGIATAWDAQMKNSSAQSLKLGSGTLFVGGNFREVRGLANSNLAAIYDMGLTSVDVAQSTSLALAGMRPNPASRWTSVVAFTLISHSVAQLEMLDLAGRRMFYREIGNLGPGSHVVNIAEGGTIAPGVYLLRLTQDKRSVARRAVIIR